MPKKKRRTKKQPEPAPVSEPIAKVKKRRRRRRKPVAEPVIVTAEPKTVMLLIFEGQRAQLDRLNEELRSKVTG
jgi:hypothetical protein